jgi:hypothetical protein
MDAASHRVLQTAARSRLRAPQVCLLRHPRRNSLCWAGGSRHRLLAVQLRPWPQSRIPRERRLRLRRAGLSLPSLLSVNSASC